MEPPRAPALVAEAQPPREPAPAWYRDPWGGALFGAGAVAVGVSLGLMAAGGAAARGAQPTYAEHAQAFEDAKGMRLGAEVGVCAGGALVVAAIVRYALAGGDP